MQVIEWIKPQNCANGCVVHAAPSCRYRAAVRNIFRVQSGVHQMLTWTKLWTGRLHVVTFLTLATRIAHSDGHAYQEMLIAEGETPYTQSISAW